MATDRSAELLTQRILNRVYGLDDEGAYDARRRAIRTIPGSETQFSEVLTAARTPIIELNSHYGVSSLRDKTTVTGSGAVSDGAGTIDITTGATASSTALLQSAEIGRYIPGYGAEIGIGVQMDAAPTGNQIATWGGLNANGQNGLYFGRDATGYFVAVLRGGSETKTYQGSWNTDTLDGTGDSGFTLDVANGHIFQILFTWYGYGAIQFGVVADVADASGRSKQRFIPVHTVKMDGQTSTEDPNFKVFAKVDNGGDASALAASIGGRQYSIVGKYVPKFRVTSEFRGNVATTTTVKPLISFRPKSGFGDRSVEVEALNAIAASAPHILEVRLDATLTGASWGTPTNHTAAETALEADKAATAVSGGIVVYQGLINSGQGNQTSFTQSALNFNIPDGATISLCARTVTSTGAVTASLFRLREEW